MERLDNMIYIITGTCFTYEPEEYIVCYSSSEEEATTLCKTLNHLSNKCDEDIFNTGVVNSIHLEGIRKFDEKYRPNEDTNYNVVSCKSISELKNSSNETILFDK